MSSILPQVLVIHSDEPTCNLLRQRFEGKADFKIVSRPSLALEEFKSAGNSFALIIITMMRGLIDSADVVREIRIRGYKGPMLASSGAPGLRDLLMMAGCDHETDGTNLLVKIEEILGIE